MATSTSFSPPVRGVSHFALEVSNITYEAGKSFLALREMQEGVSFPFAWEHRSGLEHWFSTQERTILAAEKRWEKAYAHLDHVRRTIEGDVAHRLHEQLQKGNEYLSRARNILQGCRLDMANADVVYSIRSELEDLSSRVSALARRLHDIPVEEREDAEIDELCEKFYHLGMRLEVVKRSKTHVGENRYHVWGCERNFYDLAALLEEAGGREKVRAKIFPEEDPMREAETDSASCLEYEPEGAIRTIEALIASCDRVIQSFEGHEGSAALDDEATMDLKEIIAQGIEELDELTRQFVYRMISITSRGSDGSEAWGKVHVTRDIKITKEALEEVLETQRVLEGVLSRDALFIRTLEGLANGVSSILQKRGPMEEKIEEVKTFFTEVESDLREIDLQETEGLLNEVYQGICRGLEHEGDDAIVWGKAHLYDHLGCLLAALQRSYLIRVLSEKK